MGQNDQFFFYAKIISVLSKDILYTSYSKYINLMFDW